MNNQAVVKVYAFPSNVEIGELYLNTWLPLLTSAASGQTFLRAQYGVIRAKYQGELKELRNVVSGALWFLLSWISAHIPVQKRKELGLYPAITQEAFAAKTGCKVASFASVCYDIQKKKRPLVQPLARQVPVSLADTPTEQSPVKRTKK